MTTNDAADAIMAEHENADAAMLLTSVQAATACGMSRAAWYKHLSAGKLPRPVKIGSLSRWRAEELRAWIAAGCPARTKWDEMVGNKNFIKS